MSYVDALIPGTIGLLLLVAPRAFTKAQGDKYERTKRRFQMIGGLLVTVATGYALLATIERPKEEDVSVEMHRQAVDTQDETGWYPARSTGGGYSVLMPIPFNDYTIHAKRKDGAPLEMFCLGGQSEEGFKLAVTAAKWFPQKPDLMGLYEGFREPGQTISEPSFSSEGDRSSVTFEVTGRDSGAWVRYVVTSKILVTMIIEYPNGSRDGIARHVGPFQNSLRIEEAQPADPEQRR